jgi:hypothetical protein
LSYFFLLEDDDGFGEVEGTGEVDVTGVEDCTPETVGSGDGVTSTVTVGIGVGKMATDGATDGAATTTATTPKAFRFEKDFTIAVCVNDTAELTTEITCPVGTPGINGRFISDPLVTK